MLRRAPQQDTASRIRELLYVTLLVGVVLTLLVAYCVTAHGSM